MAVKKGNLVSILMSTVFSPLGISVLLYAFCSSSLLLINKIAIEAVHAPNFILWLQLLTSALFVFGLNSAGSTTVRLEILDRPKAMRFIPAAFGFLGVIYSNIKVLQYANVETFIVFRCSTPLFLSVLDFSFLGRELPTMRAWLSLIGVLLGSVGYVLSQTTFQVNAFYWVVIWYLFFLFEMIYLKHICDTIDITNWSRVFYNNFIGLFPLTLAGFICGEHYLIYQINYSLFNVFILLLSCAVGIGMSYLSFLVRSSVSATMFTVIGIMCKIATVVLNYFYWEKHATELGIVCLLICLISGTFYKQAPMRSKQMMNDSKIEVIEGAPLQSRNIV